MNNNQNKMTHHLLKTPLLFMLLAIVAILFSVYGAVIMTETGQANNVNRTWVIFYYQYNWLFALISLVSLAMLIGMNEQYKLWKTSFLLIFSFVVIGSLLVANLMVPMMFPDRQHDAQYISISDADKLLKEKESVYAVEINGDAVAYPRRFIGLPHIAGTNIGGEDIVMTYCGLSGLPVVFSETYNGRPTKFEVLGQTHNNLLLVERKSGELIQQITGVTEFSQSKLDTYANQEMSWGTYKKLYPEGRVYLYKFDRTIDSRLIASFKPKLKKQYDPEQGPLFPTLALKDNRLNNKTRVWGVIANNKQAAYTKPYLQTMPLINTKIDNIPIVVYYDKELDVVNFFKREINGQVVKIAKIDTYGNSPQGKLERFPSYNGLMWMVWVHFYPETALY